MLVNAKPICCEVWTHWQLPVIDTPPADRCRKGEVAANIIEAQMRPDSSGVVVGDMNEPPTSAF
jgi:hypothetical protein